MRVDVIKLTVRVRLRVMMVDEADESCTGGDHSDHGDGVGTRNSSNDSNGPLVHNIQCDVLQ